MSRSWAVRIGSFLSVVLSLWASSIVADDGENLHLQKGDHLCIIGNVLAERMQHDGWLETLIQSRLPKHELVFRNLGFSGDELNERLRSKDFGTPDEWMGHWKADIVFAFFGYNESFDDESGLEQFEQELKDFIEHTLSQKYNGTSPPRLVLFSPIAFENLHNPNLPDGNEHNRRLDLYTKAMAGAAKKNDVPFVDLFHPTLQQYKTSDEPLTLNGHYLNQRGNRYVATVIDKELFSSKPRPKLDGSRIEELRQAVIDKNFYWYHRYRTTDGYNVYGGRSHKTYTDEISNREVMQREMQILDTMTSNRDRHVWAATRGEDFEVYDDNTLPFIPIKTNKPGPLEGGKHAFLEGEEAIGQMVIAKGMKITFFASEEMFPELVNPVQMAFDAKGRLWVAAWPSYPHWTPKDPMDDKLLIIEDTDGDGRADQCKTFAGGLHDPTGFEFWGGGVLIGSAPDLIFLKDTDGDDSADVRQRVLHGIDSADTHHTANSFVFGPGGALYFQEGTFHQSQIESLEGVVRNNNGCVWRFDPRTWDVDRYIPVSFANPHGHVFDSWGQDFMHDGTGAVPYHCSLFSGHLEYPQKHPRAPTLYDQRTRPCSGTEIISSSHFPEQMRGNLLVANVIGFQGILQYEIHEKGASFEGVEVEPIVYSTDPNFRPTDIEIAPDGSIFFIDWQNPIIGHLQHHIRDPSRDKTHGRIYRVTYPGRPLVDPAKIAGEPIEKLLDLLKHRDDRIRSRARIELSGRDSEEVIAATRKWIERLDTNDPEHTHHLLEALWMHQQHNVTGEELLIRLLKSPDHRARSAATHVLCYWRDRIPDSLEILKSLATDEHPNVRLEAIRAASFFQVAEAIEIPVIAADLPTDVYLDFTRYETMKALEPYWKKALTEGRDIAMSSVTGKRYLLATLSTEELLGLKRDLAVHLELLFRDGLREEHRQAAVSGIAKLENKSEVAVILDAINGLDRKKHRQTVVYDLVRMLTSRNQSELADSRDEIRAMAIGAEIPIVRQIGFVALITADAGVDKAWELATSSISRLQDLVSAMPLIPDPSLRASLYPKVEPLLRELPRKLTSSAKESKGRLGRYVRVELPHNKRQTLTLAEVEVYSHDRNVARDGKAKQINTTRGGEADRAIDGSTDGALANGGVTQTKERQKNPWWEVDLGDEFPIESIIVYNCTDRNIGKRLEGFSLKVLSADRDEIFVKEKNSAPAVKTIFELADLDPQSLVRRAAMNAVTSVRGKERTTFETLAQFIQDDVERVTAIRAIQRIPRRHWPIEEAQPLLDSLLAYVSKIPAKERTSPAILDALQLGGELASLLPADRARQARSVLGELSVRIIRIGTLPHRMAYDKERIVVQASKPVEFVFENSDVMPHNFVITRVGALEETGLAAEATAQDPAAAKRHFVPRSKNILLSSRLLQYREVQKLSFTAPRKPGVHPYVCTYPGHWRRMYGAMYVVEDLDGYLADPEAYLKSHPLPIEDELLKYNRPRKEWKFEELASSLDQLSQGRSFGNGSQMFQVANCIACHQLSEVGNQFGADLTKLDPKYGPFEILREILDPSAKIDEKYQAYSFVLDSGKIITGLVVEETSDTFEVVENPLATARPVVIKKSQIEAQKKSLVSIMPKGLLDKLTREEILDLIAYVTARGAKDHEVFGRAHKH